MAATSKVLGTVTAAVGEVRATAPDGTVRILQVGDKVFSDEVITTSANGDVKIALEGAAGRTLECGADATLALSEALLGAGAPYVAQYDSPVVPPSVAAQQEMAGTPGDVSALQAAIAAGADPSQVAEAPGAGGDESGGGHRPIIIEQGNIAGVVSAGFNTQGASIQFPVPEFEQSLVEEPLPSVSVSVSVQVEVDVEDPNGPQDPMDGVVVSGNAASLIEGTNGPGGGKLVNFIISLDKPFDVDVQVTYTIEPVTASTPEDFFDGPLTQTVTIPAGETEIIIPVIIVQDHLVESNEIFNIVLTDAVNATINPSANTAVVTIVDDDALPVANADTNWAREDTALVASGSVLESSTHTGAPSGSFADVADTDHEPLTVTNPGTYNGTYGTLLLNSDGTYSYSLNNSHPDVQVLDDGETLTDAFTYSVTDGYNTPSSSTITITIFGLNDGPEIEVRIGNDGPFGSSAESVANEAALAIGSDPESDAEFVSGSFQISDPNGLADIDSVTINGKTVAINSLVGETFNGGAGVLTITAYSNGIANFTYELTQAVTDGAGEETDVFTLTTTDGTDTSAEATITISIVDDLPIARNDGGTVAEDGTLIASGNVLTNDDGYADQPKSFVSWDSPATSAFGTVQLNADGSYTYTLNNAAAQSLTEGETHTEIYNYTMTDADGDMRSAALTITITGSDDGVTITNLTSSASGGDVTVDEDDLLSSRGAGESAGSDPSKESVTQTGTFNISAPDGVDDVTIDGHAVITNGVFAATSFTTSLGNTLALTGYNASTGEITYSYTLLDNEAHAAAGGESALFENLTVTLTDVDGDTTNATLSVNIVDDVADAVNDSNGTASENSVTLTGNVLADDVLGADGAVVTAATLNGTYGSLTIGANGAYTYTLNANDADFNALGGGGTGSEVFTYTLTDTDGDVDTATLTLAIRNDDDGVTITNLTSSASGGDVTVDEDDLLSSRGAGESAGSDPSKESVTQTGTFNISAPDGVDDVTIDGHAVITNGVFAATSFTTSLGNTLALTGYNASTGEITYSYTLLDNEAHAAAGGENSLFENLTVTLTDVDGDTTNATLSVNIVDDVPATGPAQSGVLDNQPGISLTAALPVTEGADSGVLTLSASHNGQYWTASDGTFLTSNGIKLLYVTHPDGGLSAVVEGTSNVVFTISANQPADTYTVTLSPTYPLDGATQTFLVDFTQSLGGGNSENTFFGNAQSGLVVWATGADSAPGSDTVNFSTQGMGVNTGATISGTEALTIKLLDSENWSFSTGSNPPPPAYDGSGDKYVQLSTVTLTIDSLDGPGGNSPAEQMQITAWHTNADGTLTQVTLDQSVFSGTGNGSSDTADDVFTITATGGATFDTLIFTAVGTSDYRVASMTGTNTVEGADHTISLTATITDADGDISATTWDVTFAGLNLLQGTSGNDVIVGGTGGEILVGSEGNDILTGGTGSDTFQFTGSLTAGNTDTIKDFSYQPVTSGGDVLNFHDVLPGAAQGSLDSGTLGTYVNIQTVGGNTLISVDADGAGGGAAVQVVTLEGVTGVTLQQLLNNNQIVT